MLPGFESLVEEIILKAQKNGELDNLPGHGKPLNLDDMSIPEEYRMAYRILKNSDFLPAILPYFHPNTDRNFLKGSDKI